MKVTNRSGATKRAGRRVAVNKAVLFERFAADFGPRSEEPIRGEGKAGAVELLIKLRRGEA